MEKIGIICEYNPFHLGHQKQIRQIRQHFGPDAAVICLMSGSFVQRGMPAILDKSCRAEAAVLAGADLVLELPVTCCLSSAEGFAAGGVEILGKFCTHLCFGCETGDRESLMNTARTLLRPDFSPVLQEKLALGLSFPAARQAALERFGSTGLLSSPNDILGVEYCKAILSSGCAMEPFPIRRQGSYHAALPDAQNPSATALRGLMTENGPWLDYVPREARELLSQAPVHTLAAGERAVLGKLRTMSDGEFEALPYGSEGLWRKFMHACREKATLEQIVTATKSKRYTRTRLDRMVLCAFLGLTREDLARKVPYTRVLAMDPLGRSLLRQLRQEFPILNPGEPGPEPFWETEKRCGALYGLFRADSPAPPRLEEKRRILLCSPPEA